MPPIATGVKNLFQEGVIGRDARTQQEQSKQRNREFHDRFVAERFARHATLRIGAASPDPALLEEPIVMALKEKSLNLPHRIQNDTNRDQHPGAAEEIR